MRTPEEIKKGLECCSVHGKCDKCPYDGMPCNDLELEADALAYIQQLEAERDAAAEDLTTACTSGNPCLVCSHYKPERNGLEKCELNGWVCSWGWKGKQDGRKARNEAAAR